MIVQPVPRSNLYRLARAEWLCGVKVPEGFEYNGASIPRIAWTALGYTPYHPQVMRAACLHDFLYDKKEGRRRDADDSFHRLLIEDGVSSDVATQMWAAVRQFGMNYWMDEEDRAESERREQQERERVEGAA